MKNRGQLAVLLLVIPLLLSACATEQSTPTIIPSPPYAVTIEKRVPYAGNQVIDIYAPDVPGPWPLVIAFHGGGAPRTSLAELGEAIASRGAVVFTPAWRSTPPPPDGITLGWEDAACALRFAYTYAHEHDLLDGRVVVIGHSAGAASGFVVSVAADEFSGECDASGGTMAVDAFIGLDGAFPILDFVPDSLLEQADEQEWARIDPYNYLDTSYFRPDLEIVLLTGFESELEDISASFKQALDGAGYDAAHIRLGKYSHLGMVAPEPEIMEVVEKVLFQPTDGVGLDTP